MFNQSEGKAFRTWPQHPVTPPAPFVCYVETFVTERLITVKRRELKGESLRARSVR